MPLVARQECGTLQGFAPLARIPASLDPARPDPEPVTGTVRVSFSTGLALIERTTLVLSSAAAYRLRMLLAVMAATVVLVVAVVAVVLVISAATQGSATGGGADWGAAY